MPSVLRGYRNNFLAALRGITFDLAVFSEHAHDDLEGRNQPLLCPRLVIKPNGRLMQWRQRWQPCLPDMENFARRDQPWNNDLSEFATRTAPQSQSLIGTFPGVQKLLDLRIKSIMVLPILVSDKLAASILVGSKSRGAYDEEEYKLLKAGAAERLGRDLRAALEASRERVLGNMRRLFRPGTDPEEIAAGLVTQLATELDWDFVGIYGVDQQFVLVGSCDRTKERVFRIEPRRRQDLSTGMMGTALRLKRSVRLDDAQRNPRYGYIRLDGFPAGSALCYPIEVGGRIEWMLSCACTDLAAFHGPDVEVLYGLIERLQSTLDLWFERRLSETILDAIPQSILVVDRNNLVQRANLAATAMFGDPLIGTNPASFVTAESKSLLDPIRPLERARLRLETNSGRTQTMLVTVRKTSSAFGRWVIQFTDPDEQRVLAGLQYAKAAVEEIAAQARGPLMLARTLVQRVSRMSRDGMSADLLSSDLARVEESLGKADLSYERVARSLIGREQTNLRSLLDAVRAKIQGSLDVRPVHQNAFILGDFDEVSRALTCVLQQAVNSSEPDVLCLSNVIRDDHVALRLENIETDPHDPLWRSLGEDPFRMVEDAARMGARQPVTVSDMRAAVALAGLKLVSGADGIEVHIPRARTAEGLA